jgi:hypothetical protein
MSLKNNLIAASCLTVSAIAAPLAAHAADATATGAAANPTVVVTAEHRTVNIQKAPLAITAVSARSIGPGSTWSRASTPSSPAWK